MRAKTTNPLLLFAALSIGFAVTLGGAPPSGGNEGSLEVADSVEAVAVAGMTSSDLGVVATGVQTATFLPAQNHISGLMFSVLDVQAVVKPIVTAVPNPLGQLGKPAKKEPAPKPKPIVSHAVKKGETLSDIAKKYGVDVATIASVNSLPSVHSLKVGQQLRILTVKGTLHVVQRGESLWDIAKRYQVDVNKIIEANGIADPSRLQLKQELVVPGAKVTLSAQQSTQTAARKVELVSRGKLQKVFAWPVQGRISSRFGQRWGRMHEGVDIAVSSGTPVRAAAAGKVTFAGWNGAYGYLVKISHGNGVETRYAHNSKILVKVGQAVSSGQVLARSGSTGRSTGPHVHFEIRLNGKAYNPLNYLR